MPSDSANKAKKTETFPPLFWVNPKREKWLVIWGFQSLPKVVFFFLFSFFGFDRMTAIRMGVFVWKFSVLRFWVQIVVGFLCDFQLLVLCLAKWVL